MKTAGSAPLLLLALLSIGLYVVIVLYGVDQKEHRASPLMRKAVERTARCYERIGREKAALGLISETEAPQRRHPMLGVEYSEITTTLGSHDAKIASANPEFAALAVRFLADAGVDSNQKVGVTLSGSFPGIAVAVLSALEEMHVTPVIVSSLGASSFGANQPAMTWADMEFLLFRDSLLSHRSVFVTPGAECDTGGGMMEEGIGALRRAAARAHSTLRVPSSIESAVEFRESLFVAEHISFLINIGGNHALLGACPHGVSLPNGFHLRMHSCGDSGRGVLMKMSERGMPFFHFLNIRDLAREYGIEEDGVDASPSPSIYHADRINRIAAGTGIAAIALGVILISLRHKRKK